MQRTVCLRSRPSFVVTTTTASFVEDEGVCIETMFMASATAKARKSAHLACMAQFAFQRNWYPDPIAGLFSYQTWNGMDGFWQDGIAIETMANAMHYGNHSRYFSVVKVIGKL